jgi:hypothetical protein
MGQVHVQFVDVGMEYPVYEADARTFVGILIRQLNMDLPEAALERCCVVLMRKCRRAGVYILSSGPLNLT